MSIFGDHSDVMNCRQTGFAMLSSSDVQEVMDMGAIAHLTAIKCKMPFIHFFDGFRTSHEIQKINVPDYHDLSELVDYAAVDSFRHNALNPDHPTLRNTVQNPDIYFQVREANNIYYDRLPEATMESMRQINQLTGSNYALFNYYGVSDAENVIIAMGSVSGPIRETIDKLNATGEKTGFVQVHLYRPFSIEYFLKAMPKTVKIISVLDRTKESGAIGEPLYQDICTVYTNKVDAPMILGGRYGLSSKDTAPKHIKAVFDNMKTQNPKNHFTIGIVDDVNYLSLCEDASFRTGSSDVRCCKFWGLGSDGTVGANKNSIKIIGDNTENYVQAYFEYDTKKSFGVTKSHLRVGKQPIRSSYLVKEADFVACHNQSYIEKYDIVSEIKKGGTFLLNCDYDVQNLSCALPAGVKKYLAENEIAFYIIDANKISRSLGLGDRINIVLQAAFFKLFDVVPLEDAIGFMKQAIEETYRKKGEKIIAKNICAIESGLNGLMKVEIPESWKQIGDSYLRKEKEVLPEFIEKILMPINAQKGDELPVSTFANCSDGTMPLGTSAFEKRGIATVLPKWKRENCIQCNRCSLVCPHAAIRPYLLDEKEKATAPAEFEMIRGVGKNMESYFYSLQVSDLDCTGCGSCANVCPAKEKALSMVLSSEKKYFPVNWEYGLSVSVKENAIGNSSIKASQFKQPLYEFSGACAGCGETPYAKLLTQLFGDKMFWVNATGCSQAWGASMPSIPYTKDKNGSGPAWSNSLFENNAEFAFGMLLSSRQQRIRVKEQIIDLKMAILKTSAPEQYQNVVSVIDDWLEAFDDLQKSTETSKRLALQLSSLLTCKDVKLQGLSALVLKHKDQFARKTVWMFGGDGWAYDIGYGGLDHVVATGEDINVFIVDTEVYSNTGGQSSKATPLGAVAQFQASGKKIPKKNLGKQLMSYGNIYVASVAMGADSGQLLKAINEAESYCGPSVIIAYTPCIVHGIKAGMDKVQEEMKRAVESGYWPLYRFDPRKEQPFQLDSGKRSLSYREFIEGEVRYASLEITYPENAERLFEQAEYESEKSFEEYKVMGEAR
jgi:pyruvate-ferredoxin/flavodoxin oxidoreductase